VVEETTGKLENGQLLSGCGFVQHIAPPSLSRERRVKVGTNQNETNFNSKSDDTNKDGTNPSIKRIRWNKLKQTLILKNDVTNLKARLL